MLFQQGFVSFKRYQRKIALRLRLVELGFFLLSIQMDQKVARADLGARFERNFAHDAGQIGANGYSIDRYKAAHTIHGGSPIGLLGNIRRHRCRRRSEGAGFLQFYEALDLVKFHKSQAEHGSKEETKEHQKNQKVLPERLLFHNWAGIGFTTLRY